MEKENGYMTVDDDTVNSIEEKMPIESELYELADLFKVFGDSTRIKILYVLYENEMCVFDIAKILNMFRIQALPLLRQSENTSKLTLGRAS